MTTQLDPGAAAAARHRQLDHPHYHRGWWWKTLLAGLALWLLTTGVTILTRNSNLVPTLILLGSFLVPFCVVMFVAERIVGNTSVLQVILAFFIGGVCGVLGASLLESELKQTVLLYVAVGLIEEFVKGAILVIVGWRVQPKTAAQGALLGAVVGAGFAAFESAGYAFNAGLTGRGLDIISLLHTEVLRAVLTPVDHVLWTSILGAVLFAASRDGRRFRFTGFVLLAYAGVAVLHALWDSMSGITAVIALLATGTAAEQLRYGSLPPSAQLAVQSLATALYFAGIVVVSILGVLALTLVLRHYRRRSRLHLPASGSWPPPDARQGLPAGSAPDAAHTELQGKITNG